MFGLEVGLPGLALFVLVADEPLFETSKVEKGKAVQTGPDGVFARDDLKADETLVGVVLEGLDDVGREFSEGLFLRDLLLFALDPEQLLVLLGELLDRHRHTVLESRRGIDDSRS